MKKKKISLFPLLLLVCFPLVLLIGGLFFCFHSQGFSPSKIGSNLLFNENWEVEPLTEQQRAQLINEAFPQTYYYLGSETHCYVFVSKNRNYVLKFFKTKSLSPREWWSYYPLPSLRFLGLGSSFDNQFLSEHIFANYKNAYDSLRSESGLIYVHLNRTKEFQTRVRLIDAHGHEHLVDLDSFEFILQKKGEPLFKRLNALVAAKQWDAVRETIRSFLQLVAIRCEKGFAAQNVSLNTHYGFVGSQPIVFDCGILSKDPSMKYPLSVQREVLKAAERLNVWANERCAEVVFMVQEEAQHIINQVF